MVIKLGTLRVYLESTTSSKTGSLQPQGKRKKTDDRIDRADENLHPEVGQPYAFALPYDVLCLLFMLF